MVLRNQALFISLLIVLAIGFGVIMGFADYNAQGGLLVALALAVIAFPLLYWLSKTETSQWFLFILSIGLAAKLSAAIFRMNLNLRVYGNLYDAGRYHKAGVNIAKLLWDARFENVISHARLGTAFTEVYSGIVHALIGPTVSGAYMVFGFLAFIGSCFLYKGFCIAFPHGNRFLYAIFAFLYPSLIYWANGIGKDALMSLFIGLAVYGSALMLTKGRLNGLIPLALGLTGCMTVRPHVAGILGIAFLAAFALGGGNLTGRASLIWRTLVVVVGVLVLAHFMPTILQKAGIGELDIATSGYDTLSRYYETRQRSTGGGGSAFEAPSFVDPLFVPKAVFTVLFRPMVWEAHNSQAMVQALDGVLLLGLMVWRAGDVFRSLIGFRNNPYVIFIVVFTVLLSIALMTVANFGTLARERAMLLPLVLMLIASRPLPIKRIKQTEPDISIGSNAKKTFTFTSKSLTKVP